MVDNQSSNIIKKLQSDLENTEKYINELILDLNDLSETLPESLEIKSLLENTKKEIINAWNALLIGMPQENIQLLKNLSKQYRLFLLSNTNSIHIDRINKFLYKDYNLKSLEPLFDKVYLSHQIGMRKPNSETFEWVLKDAEILAQETLFIEDSIQHIESASKVGIQTQLWRTNEPFKGFFLDKAL